MRSPAPTTLTVVVGLLLLTRPALLAQGTPLGTFRWQLQPFCNAVTLSVVQQGGVYTVDGYDDQCGAAQRAPLVGLATPNPDGSIGLGLHVVTVPGGRGVHIDARISLATLSGPWSDSAGNTGTFAFGSSTAGTPRPLPTVPASAIAAGTITAAHLAPGVIGVVAQARVSGVCANGQALRGVNPDGSVVCTAALTTVDDPANDVGFLSSIAIGVDGLPVISHQDTTASALRVTHCGNPACTAGNVSTTVDGGPGNAVGDDTSIAIGADGLPVISHWGTSDGTLRVTHCGNATCTAGNVSTTVDDPVNVVGRYTSIAIGADGLPVISHQDTTANALRVTHCGNAACTAGNTSVTVDDPAVNIVGYNTSIAIGADGFPIVSHNDSTAGALRVTHCGNAACTAGNVSTTADDAPGDAGNFSSIAIGVDGRPVISHQLADFGALRVTHCGNAACTAGNVSTTVDGPDHFVGTFSAIAIGADGLPVISHMDETAAGLRVTHCGNAACTAGNVSTTVDDPVNDVGYYTSLAIGADGLPVISHVDLAVNALRVTHCGNVACTAGSVSTTVDDPTNAVGFYNSIALGADGLPVISYLDNTADALRVTHCGNAACTAGNVSTTVDDPTNAVGNYTSIAVGVDGLPVISHVDLTATALRVTHCGNAACTAGNTSTTVDDPANRVDSYTSVAISPDGFPVIGYMDVTAGTLKVAKCGTRTCL